ncbi:hypothetical protein GpartN1_g2424.t1 [Galdieria partita]|uniref:Uncharacterized protein n=1 Tax=Galdieria partita TaxID=83374 RepID=A0A9C7PTT4_9RHOD|nr:hypothetical protein GpartN1_g2424.t1 [Galdieria partita]
MQTDQSPSECFASDLSNFPRYNEETFRNYRPRDSPSSTKHSFVIYLAVQDCEPFHYTVVNGDDSGLVLREIDKACCYKSKKRDRSETHKWSRGDKKTREQEN